MNKNYLETFPIIMPEMISGMFDIFEQFNINNPSIGLNYFIEEQKDLSILLFFHM